MKAKCIFVILSCLIFSCNTNSKNHAEHDNPTRSVAYDEKTDSSVNSLIERLPEFKNLELRFKEKLDLSHHLALFSNRRPSAGFRFYEMQAGDDNPDRFEPMYDFYVDLKDSAVFFHDTISDSVLTISQWRKSGKDDLWHP